MAKKTSVNHSPDRRSEPRQPSKKFHSVEMKLASLPIYLFKLKEISSNGACFMVKEGSVILKHLQVGQILNMRYHADDEVEPSEVFKSKIKHITKALENPYKGHYAVGIMLLEKQTQLNPGDDLD
jgi:hypothetical protein